MKQKVIQIRMKEYERLEELTEMQVNLVNRAIESAGNAYAPYSGYHVGAAVLLANGKIVTGNNQENAAYPSGLCAERVAIFYAGSQYPDVPVSSIAIAAIRDGTIQEEPVSPCGGCRQVLCEKEFLGATPIEVILYGNRRIQVIQQATDLLPLPFILRKGD
ncbi:MAG: cytidine deaminase [Bacteroidales bacterium]|nr:cytidine deaminase [Bacteroidales bacterium]